MSNTEAAVGELSLNKHRQITDKSLLYGEQIEKILFLLLCSFFDLHFNY